jgi:hypothetical protein
MTRVRLFVRSSRLTAYVPKVEQIHMKPFRTMSSSSNTRRMPHVVREPVSSRVDHIDRSAAVRAFVDALFELTLADWLDAGRRVLAERTSTIEHDATRARLSAAVESARLAVAAWEVCDALETAAYVACPHPENLTRATRRRFAAAHAAAEDMAVAILVGDELARGDRAILFAAFSPAASSRRDRSPAPTA